jgi:hypothetical protein
MRCIFAILAAISFGSGYAMAFEPPLFPLNDAQIKALADYAGAKTEKAFALGPNGKFSAQTGFASASVAVRDALKTCDGGESDPTLRCIIIDLNGSPVPLALQYAQISRADPTQFEKPIPLRDFTLDADAWAADKGLAEKPEHRAFAASLKGPWARSWEAATVEEAEKQALEACNKNDRAKTAPCFILAKDRQRVNASELHALPDLSVAPIKAGE